MSEQEKNFVEGKQGQTDGENQTRDELKVGLINRKKVSQMPKIK